MPDSPKDHILNLLAKEWEMTGPPGILDISDIASLLPLAPSDVMAGIRELFSYGFIDANKLNTSVWLTPEGYEKISTHSGDADETD